MRGRIYGMARMGILRRGGKEGRGIILCLFSRLSILAGQQRRIGQRRELGGRKERAGPSAAKVEGSKALE